MTKGVQTKLAQGGGPLLATSRGVGQSPTTARFGA